MKSSPHFFGQVLINGVLRLARRWTKTSALEIVPPEELAPPAPRTAEDEAWDAEFEMSRRIAEFKDPQGARLLAARIPRKDR